jgi:hypothetical protein
VNNNPSKLPKQNFATPLSLSKPTIFKTQNYRMHIVLRFFKNPRTFRAPEEEEENKEALEASKRI